MRKKIFILMFAVMILFLTGCSFNPSFIRINKINKPKPGLEQSTITLHHNGGEYIISTSLTPEAAFRKIGYSLTVPTNISYYVNTEDGNKTCKTMGQYATHNDGVKSYTYHEFSTKYGMSKYHYQSYIEYVYSTVKTSSYISYTNQLSYIVANYTNDGLVYGINGVPTKTNDLSSKNQKPITINEDFFVKIKSMIRIKDVINDLENDHFRVYEISDFGIYKNYIIFEIESFSYDMKIYINTSNLFIDYYEIECDDEEYIISKIDFNEDEVLKFADRIKSKCKVKQ